MVKVVESTGEAILMCLMHSYESGCSWNLPPEKPDDLPEDVNYGHKFCLVKQKNRWK
jgi:hypothetical protein